MLFKSNTALLAITHILVICQVMGYPKNSFNQISQCFIWYCSWSSENNCKSWYCHKKKQRFNDQYNWKFHKSLDPEYITIKQINELFEKLVWEIKLIFF